MTIMRVELETEDKQQVSVHYVNTPPPYMVEEKFGGHSHDNEDLELQESLYLSLQRNAHIDIATSSSSNNPAPNHNCHRNRGEGNSSGAASVDSQLAIDEALAKELQELENQLSGTSIRQTAGAEAGKGTTISESSSGNVVLSNSVNTSAQVARPDDIDPDNMTYEELQTLGEAIGAESRGLSDELISFLPSSTYKIGLFSKKDKHEECVICCMAYKNRDKLIALPCLHQYHKNCVTRWLKINKACPICNVDVFGS